MGDAEQGTEKTPLVKKTTPTDSKPSLSRTTVQEDAWDTLQLGIPIFISMLSWVGVSFQVQGLMQ